MDFSERHSEEVMFLLTLSVHSLRQYKLFEVQIRFVRTFCCLKIELGFCVKSRSQSVPKSLTNMWIKCKFNVDISANNLIKNANKTLSDYKHKCVHACKYM